MSFLGLFKNSMFNEQKIKAIILIAIIAVVAAGFGVYILKQKKAQTATSQQSQANQSQSNEQPASKQTIVEEGVILPPAEITGKVVGMTSASWIIDQPTGAIEVGIKIDTPVFKNEGSVKKPMSVTDVRAGTEITAKLDSATGAVLEAIIIK